MAALGADQCPSQACNLQDRRFVYVQPDVAHLHLDLDRRIVGGRRNGKRRQQQHEEH